MKTTLGIFTLSTLLLLASCAQEPDNSEVKNKQTASQVKTAQDQNKKVSHQVEVLTAPQAEVEAIQVSRSRLAQASQMKGVVAHLPPVPPLLNKPAFNNEKYAKVQKNGTTLVSEQAVSTFSIDVDTAAYSNIRRLLNDGKMPQGDTIRLEELINYFSYDYPAPKNHPFSVYSEVGPSPYNADKQLIHIGIQGKAVPKQSRPAANLVFLIDVSGSMNTPNKLGLLKNALKMLTKQLTEHDSVAIVVYAGAAGTVLPATSGDNKPAILDALAQLSAGGSTNGGAGIEAAYRLAQKNYIKDGINRVMLATDGDFNVGTVNNQALQHLIEQQRQSGIELSILGLGKGNYNDELMQQLAQNGNGNAYYIDNLNEARKVLVDELSSTLFTIAKDVKIQMEFNPQLVSEYRLIGYETRALKREDFNNDKVDAGEIGAGHSVTAIYEISLVDGTNKAIEPLRYQNEKVSTNKHSDELAFLRLRYKTPNQDTSKLIEQTIKATAIKNNLANTSDNFKFSAAVAGFGELLQGGKHLTTMDESAIIALAQQSKGDDLHGYRSEFISLVKLAQALKPLPPKAPNAPIKSN